MRSLAVAVLCLFASLPAAADDARPNLDLRAEGAGRLLVLKSWVEDKAGRFAMTLHREGRKVEEWWGSFRADAERGWLHLERRTAPVDAKREHI